MAAAGASGGSGDVARLRMMCSHGGRFQPCGPDGGIRYVGGETRVLVVPRSVSFRELAAKLGEMEVGKIVSAVRYRLADDDGVLVSVTSDEELAHLRDDYDRLKATSPSASFRVFFSGQRRAASGRPPLPPNMRRVQSAPALAARARARVHCGAAPVPMRRVQSAEEFAGCSRFQPTCYDYESTTGATSATAAATATTTSTGCRRRCPMSALHLHECARCAPRTCSRGSDVQELKWCER
ncbi:hypothetical protein ACQ4PT_030285 [Festuca glaucescens]